MEAERSMQPIFRPLKGKFKPFGIPWYILLGIVATVICGLVATVATGSITHAVEAEYSASETVNMKATYLEVESELMRIEAVAREKGVRISDLELSAEQRATLEKASEMGLRVGMTEDEVAAAMPKTHQVQEPLFPTWLRAALFMALPAIVGVSLFIEVNRTSLWRELLRWRAYRKAQREFRSLPITYVERACGMPYREACGKAREDGSETWH